MQIKTKIKYTSALVAAALSITPMHFAYAETISIVNAGFEDKFDGWDDTDPSSISGNANSGKKSVKVSGSGGKVEQVVTVTVDTNYQLSAYVKGTGSVGAIVDGTYHSVSGGGDKDFEKVTLSFNSKNATSITIFGAYDSEQARFDDFVLESALFDSAIPYDYSEFQTALDSANLQLSDLSDCIDGDVDAYCSKSDVVKAGGFADYSSEHFYIDAASGWLTFEMEGDSNRSELRFTENFKTNSGSIYSLSAEILPISPLLSVSASGDGKEMTLLQVHNKGENAETDSTVLSHPLARIIWDGESRVDPITGFSYSEAYWVVIKNNAYECSDSSKDAYVEDCPDSYEQYYLGQFDATAATKFEIVAGNDQLIVNVDDVEIVNHDISYWAHLYSYFKAGVYNQYERGNSTVQFKSLNYSEQIESLLPEADLDKTVTPSENFDLSKWNLSVPIDNGEGDGYEKATTVTVEKLNDGYEAEDYFWTSSEDGGMVFKDYIAGAKTSLNTTYTRTELREMLRGEDTSIATQGVNDNNWVFSSVPNDLQVKAGGIDGNMMATLAVNHVTTTGYSGYVGRVIIGQIHAASDEPIRIYYRLLPGHTKGSIYFAHEPSNGNDEQYYEMIGSKSSSADEPEDGIELNEKFSYEIDIAGDMMTVTITREDGSTVVQEVDMSESGYSDGYYDKDGDGVDETEDYMYFKAGVYNQNKLVDLLDVNGDEIDGGDGIDDNGAEADDYVQATFYYLNQTHSPAPEDTDTDTDPSTNQVAQITDISDTDTGELRYKLSEAQTAGSVKASFFYEEGGSTSAYLGLFDSANSVSSDIADIRLKSGKIYLRTEADSSLDIGVSFPEGEWFELEVKWDTAVDNTYTLYVDGVAAGTFDAENTSAAVQTLAIRFNSNSSTTTETLYVDNFEVYSDEAATELVYADDFESAWSLDDSLDVSPYNSSTQEAVVVIGPALASDETDSDSDTDSGSDSDTDSGGDSDTDSGGDNDTDSDSDSDSGSDGDTDSSSDSDSDSDTDSDVTVPVYNQVAQITDTTDTDTGELRYKLTDAQTEGAFTASIYYPVDGSITAYISLFDSANSVSSDIADIRLKSGGVYLRTEADSSFDTGFTFPEGEWFDIKIIWDTASNNTYSLYIDDAEVGTFVAENLSAAVQTLAIRFNSNSGVTDETIYVDNFEIYADQTATTLVQGDDFDSNWSVGDSLNTSPYNSSTQEAIVTYDPTLDIDTDVDTDTDSDIDPSTAVPYDYAKYQDALNKANLQQTDITACTDGDINAYCSKSDVVDAGEYAGYDSEYFYIDETTGWLTFEMEGDSNRTELRFEENFLTNSADLTYSLSAEILPISPYESVANSADGQEMTLLQVHNKGENGATDDTVLSHPLLRVVWDGETLTDDFSGESYTGAYWAMIKSNAYECSDTEHYAYVENCPDSYDRIYLGDYDAEIPTKFEIITGNQQLIINVDDAEAVNYDISYWAHLYSYYKAGVYNQYEDGNSVVQFKSISYVEMDANEEAVNDLDTAAAPSENFDLSTWNLSVPIDNGEGDGYAKATTVTVKDLNESYELADYFWTDTSDGGMVFKDYIDGARTSENTTYTRTELREMLRGEDTSISTQGVNGNNWVFSSVPAEQQAAAGGVDGNMFATLAVNHVTTTGKSSYQGRVIIGQIHAASDEPIRIYYRLLPGHTKGSIYFAHEPSNGNDEQYYEMIGSKSSSADEPEDGIALNEKFSYEIDIAGNLMTVTITRTDGSTVVQEVDMTDSGYADGYYDKDGDGVDETEDYMYFKAGVYNQNKLIDELDEDGNEVEGGDGIDDNGAEADDYVQATFYSLSTTH